MKGNFEISINKMITCNINVTFISGNTKVVDLLIRSGADIEAMEIHRACPLYYAASRGKRNNQMRIITPSTQKNDLFCPKCVDKTSNINFLIRKYLKIFGEHKQELQNDVIIDTFLGHWEIVYLLLLNGADANKQIINGDTALHVATEKGIQSG